MLNTLESDPDAELPGKASEDTQGGGLGSALADGAAGSPSPTHFGEAPQTRAHSKSSGIHACVSLCPAATRLACTTAREPESRRKRLGPPQPGPTSPGPAVCRGCTQVGTGHLHGQERPWSHCLPSLLCPILIPKLVRQLRDPSYSDGGKFNYTPDSRAWGCLARELIA